MWLRRYPEWVKLGALTADADGVVLVPMRVDRPKGEYRLRPHAGASAWRRDKRREIQAPRPSSPTSTER